MSTDVRSSGSRSTIVAGGDLIDRFFDDAGFLSNFSAHPVCWQDVIYPTAEAAFQAGKTLDPVERARLAATVTPGEAKRLGRMLTLRSGWDDHERHVVMREVLAAKFTDPDLADRLVATGTALLVEGNTWHDQFCARLVSDRIGPAAGRVLAVRRFDAVVGGSVGLLLSRRQFTAPRW